MLVSFPYKSTTVLITNPELLSVLKVFFTDVIRITFFTIKIDSNCAAATVKAKDHFSIAKK
jgi:hypothetical protein